MELALEQKSKRNKIHPQRFAVWVGCASMFMVFMGLSSAYMVRQPAGNWLEFQLPQVFMYSTAVILLSSLTLHASYAAFKKENEVGYKGLLIFTALLSLVFFALQYQGWQQMNDMGIPFTLNPSGDFVFVISWLHAAHVVGGLAILTVALIHAFALKFKVTEKRKLRFQMTYTYWHFVDLLWVYLFLFLTIYR